MSPTRFNVYHQGDDVTIYKYISLRNIISLCNMQGKGMLEEKKQHYTGQYVMFMQKNKAQILGIRTNNLKNGCTVWI